MKKYSFRDRIRYSFDNTFSKGPIALITWLFVASLVVIIVAAAIISTAGIKAGDVESLSFMEAFWVSLMRTLDAGTMGGDTGWAFRLVMFVVTLAGVFVVSTLIGILSSGIEQKIEELRKGRSMVIESGHTVILGWSEQVFTIISELVRANENAKNPCIVVLGEIDKVEMEDAIRLKIGSTKNTRVVCRNGSPMEMADLKIASINQSRSVIILSPEDNSNPDSEVIKVVVAITNMPDRRSEPYHIVAELRNPENLSIAKVVGKDEVEWVKVGDLIARIIAQTCRQSGLSVVYNELLDFGGDEIYFFPVPAKLIGKTFADALTAFEKNAVIGIRQTGQLPKLNPSMDTILDGDTRLILIAEDDDKIILSDKVSISDRLISQKRSDHLDIEHTLLLGWNWKAPSIIRELEAYVTEGSGIHVVADIEDLGEQIAEVEKTIQKQKISWECADATDRKVLDQLDYQCYNHIVLLCYSDKLDTQEADARTLITLLHLRDISEKQNMHYSVVSEMIDIRNRNLAEVTRADDFIVSDKLVSLMLAQVSENKQLNAVFEDLFDPDGSEIYLKKAEEYVVIGQPVNFYTVARSASMKNQVAFGYRLTEQSKDASRSYGVFVNPAKSDTVIFGPQDSIIVLSEE
ncbi:MAG: potassium transporter TrkA [Anaerolineaceae bacterium]|nr:potassium transporter TrkA [Anaerolineaceae bacterium]